MSYLRKSLDDIEGYTPGEQPPNGDLIKLNTNENPYPPSPKVVKAMQGLDGEVLRKYPDPLATEFRNAVAQTYAYPGADWVIAGNGMDELLALALRSFVEPGQEVLSVYPTYSLYEVLCALHGAPMKYVELDEAFALPEAFYGEQAPLCFLARPNAPTGLCTSRENVKRFCENFNGVVVIDEAYVDFADDDCMDLPKLFDNVIVMRTFSKSFSLAGMRLGIAVANPDLIAGFLKTKDSYNMDAVTQHIGLAAINDMPYTEANAEKVRASRTKLRDALLELGFNVPPSQTNFLLTRCRDAYQAKKLFEQLRDAGILVRYFNKPRLDNALRITVGTDEECNALINQLKKLLA
jgi:histidinol-phosphate aminotransferase